MSIETRLRDAAEAAGHAVAAVEPAARLGQLGRARRRRTLAAAASALVLLATVAVLAGVVVARQQPDLPAVEEPRPVAGPAGPAGRVVARIPVAGGEGRSFSLAAGGGAVWVYDAFEGLVRVDPATRVRTRVVGQGFRDVAQLVAGPGAVWVLHTPDAGSSWALSRVDAATGQVAEVRASGAPTGGATLLGGGVWGARTLPPADLVGIDARSGRLLRRVAYHAAELAAGDGGLVAVGAGGRGAARVDTRTGTVTPLTGLGPGRIEHAAVGAGAAWLTRDDGSLTRVELATGAVTSIPVAPGPLDNLAYGAGGVWVSSEACAVYRVDPASGRVLGRVAGTGLDELPPESHIGELVVEGGAVWVKAYLRGLAHLLEIDPSG